MHIAGGPWHIDDTLTFTVVTHRFDTGALTDADSVPSYRIYEDETGTAILNGSMAKLDDGNTTGFYSEQITLSAANGFEIGKSYNVYVTAAVNSVTGGDQGGFKVVGDFYARLGTPAGASIAADLVAIDNFVDDIESRLGTPSNLGGGATIAQNLADIEAQTDDIGVAGAGLTAITSKTDNLPSDPADASVVAGLIAGVDAKVDIIDGNVDSILVDTAEIGAAGAGLTNINLPDQTMNITGNITGNLSGSVGSLTTNNDKTGYRLSSTGVDDVLDEVVEGSYTLRQFLRLFAAALLGKASGLETTNALYRDTGDSKNRIDATVDADGNRTAVTLDAS